MAWTFYSATGEELINDGGVSASAAVFTGKVDLGSNLLVGNAGSTGIAISSAGEVTMAAQPCFLVKPSSEAEDVTGAGTDYTMVYATEIFDQNADFDGTSTFTAPITGRYFFCGSIAVNALSSMESFRVMLVASNRTHDFYAFNATTIEAGNILATLILPFAAMVDMDAADTVTVLLDVTGGSDAVNASGRNHFGGFLIA